LFNNRLGLLRLFSVFIITLNEVLNHPRPKISGYFYFNILNSSGRKLKVLDDQLRIAEFLPWNPKNKYFTSVEEKSKMKNQE